jgi:hypothetical protein
MILRSVRSRSRRPRFLPTPRDRAVLLAVRTLTRMSGGQIRRLFFRSITGRLASPQTVNARLRRLTDVGYLDVVIIDRGHGAGPYAYGLGPHGAALLDSAPFPRRRAGPGPVWHYLEIAELRVRLEEQLRVAGGTLVEWLGDSALRALLRGERGWPVPDAVVHWQLRGREGVFLLEWDRGTESLAVLVAKLRKYGSYARSRGHRQLLPGLGLRPRLAIVVGDQRHARLLRYLRESRFLPNLTIAVGAVSEVTRDPFGRSWWRSDMDGPGSLFS